MMLLPCALLCLMYVWEASCARTAQIEAILMDPNTMQKINSSYYFGIYGKNSLDVATSGHLVHVRSQGNLNHGCSDYDHDLPNHGWVALIERGQCYFTTKIHMATKVYNASAVIIYDNAPSNELVSMQSDFDDEVFLFVKQSFGRRLRMMADSGMHVHVNITPIDTSDAVTTTSATSALLLCGTLLLSFFMLTI